MSEIRHAKERVQDAGAAVRVSTVLPDGEVVAIPVEPFNRQHDAQRLARASVRPPHTD